MNPPKPSALHPPFAAALCAEGISVTPRLEGNRQQRNYSMETELLNALLLAIRALNATPDFNTGIPCPDNPERTLRSYRLIPQLETVARKAKASAPNLKGELLTALERAFDILDGIADKLLYEEGQPVTAIESRENEDIYNDAICELAPFETLIRRARGEA
jgi:hypothetical protein